MLPLEYSSAWNTSILDESFAVRYILILIYFTKFILVWKKNYYGGFRCPNLPFKSVHLFIKEWVYLKVDMVQEILDIQTLVPHTK